jgi:hypothetical protein
MGIRLDLDTDALVREKPKTWLGQFGTIEGVEKDVAEADAAVGQIVGMKMLQGSGNAAENDEGG